MSDKYVGKPIGMQNVTFFPLTADAPGTPATYAAPIKVGRAMRATITPQESSALLESDDSVEDDVTMFLGYNLNFDISQILDSVRAQIFGHTIDDHGGMVINKLDQAVEGALAWRSLLSTKTGNEEYKYFVLYKVKLKEFEETFETLKRGGLVFQTHSGVTGTAMSRESDGNIMYTMRTDQTDFSEQKAGAWFTEVQEKTVTPSP